MFTKNQNENSVGRTGFRCGGGYGRRNGSLTVAAMTVLLMGATALAAPPSLVEVYNGVDLIAHQGEHDFGTMQIGDNGSLGLRILNIGTQPFSYVGDKVTFTDLNGGDASDLSYGLVFNTTTVPGGGFTLFNMSFVPTSDGDRKILVTVHTDDAFVPNYEFSIIANVEADQNAPNNGSVVAVYNDNVYIAPGDAIELGEVVIGDSVNFNNLRIHNTGTDKFTYVGDKFTIEELSDGNVDDFAAGLIINSVEVAPGAPSYLGLTFTPTSAGERKAEITIHTDDPVNPNYSFLMIAQVTALQPKFVMTDGFDEIASGDEYDLGQTTVGQSIEKTFKIENNGDAPLTLTDVDKKVRFTELTGGNVDDFSYTLELVGQNEDTIQPNQFGDLAVTFAPSEPGPRKVEMSIESNDPDAPQYSMILLADALEAVVEEYSQMKVEKDQEPVNDGDTYDLGKAALGQIVSDTLVIRNDGDATLAFTGSPEKVTLTELTGGDVADFTAQLSKDGLEPGDSAILTLSFSPTSIGLRDIEMTIETNDPNATDYTVQLTAEGFDEDLVEPEAKIEVLYGPNRVNIDDEVDMGEVTIGQTATLGLTVLNAGDAKLVFTGDPEKVTLTELTTGNAADFSVTLTVSELDPEGLALLAIEFSPSSEGEREVEVLIESNDPSAPEFFFIATAAGVEQVEEVVEIEDCNENGTVDDEDLADGTSEDCNENDVPDECEKDSDGDGFIDGCDRCPGEDDASDVDEDDVSDCLDNCPNVFNPFQTDSDGNGTGDACEGEGGENASFCGAGVAGMLPAMMLGLGGMRLRRRRS